jgi:DNA-binding MarR family transcriptional regulator
MLAQVALSTADLATLNKLRKVINLVQDEIDPDIPIGYFRTMVELMIAHIDSGPNRVDLTQKDLLERTGMPQSSISRAVNALSDNRREGEGYNIADNVPHPLDRRYRHVRLNPRGRALMGKIIEVLRER